MQNTTTTISASLAPPTRFMTQLAGMLVNDIDADKFADSLGTTINHPAFILGHLSYYAGMAMQLLGGDMELSDEDTELYQHGAECKSDPALYPSKDAAIAAFNERINTVADFIETCDEAAFAKSSAETPFFEKMPTMGAVATFMLVGHVPFHLGQISAWRRIAGMGSAS